ncbi:MAG: PIN domain-containing protein [Caulobacteraceae bacterium]
MNLLVDTSVWSLAFRRDRPDQGPHVERLSSAIDGDTVVTTGLILQELLQGFLGAAARDQIVERFAALPLLVPDRRDHIDAADLRTRCRRSGVQVGTIDALIASLAIRYDLTILSTDADFTHMAPIARLKLWAPAE